MLRKEGKAYGGLGKTVLNIKNFTFFHEEYIFLLYYVNVVKIFTVRRNDETV